jgi:hypothetical protein
VKSTGTSTVSINSIPPVSEDADIFLTGFPFKALFNIFFCHINKACKSSILKQQQVETIDINDKIKKATGITEIRLIVWKSDLKVKNRVNTRINREKRIKKGFLRF